MLLWTESFDLGSVFTNRYASYNYAGLVVPSGGTARTDKAFLVNNGGNHVQTGALVPGSTTAIVGVAFWTSAFGTTAHLIEVREGSTAHCTLYLDASGYLKVYRAGSTLLATSSVPLTTYCWYYVEFKVTVHDTAGEFTVQVDGSTFGGLTASSQDTRNGG